MTAIEMAILVGFGVPIVLLTGAFVVLVTWLQVNEAAAPAHGEA